MESKEYSSARAENAKAKPDSTDTRNTVLAVNIHEHAGDLLSDIKELDDILADYSLCPSNIMVEQLVKVRASLGTLNSSLINCRTDVKATVYLAATEMIPIEEADAKE